jgi:hypothetical protein
MKGLGMLMKKVSEFLIMIAMLFANCSFVSATVKTGWDLNAPLGMGSTQSEKYKSCRELGSIERHMQIARKTIHCFTCRSVADHLERAGA